VPSRSLNDETYVVDLSDDMLGTVAQRQHRFGLLRGDAKPGKQEMKLPMDTCNSDGRLVVEYRERQHTEVVPIMDRRMTVSDVDRGIQMRSTISAVATSCRGTALSWWNYPALILPMTSTRACVAGGERTWPCSAKLWPSG